MKTPYKAIVAVLLGAMLITGCAVVDVTKTAKGHYDATNPNDVEILVTRPDRPYEELGTVTASQFMPQQTATMHNAIRSKAAPLGADAVILITSGILPNGRQWANGVAIRWITSQKPATP
jgi:PBP1b-binding outer membrane lipoprotein LpoB